MGAGGFDVVACLSDCSVALPFLHQRHAFEGGADFVLAEALDIDPVFFVLVDDEERGFTAFVGFCTFVVFAEEIYQFLVVELEEGTVHSHVLLPYQQLIEQIIDASRDDPCKIYILPEIPIKSILLLLPPYIFLPFPATTTPDHTIPVTSEHRIRLATPRLPIRKYRNIISFYSLRDTGCKIMEDILLGVGGGEYTVEFLAHGVVVGGGDLEDLGKGRGTLSVQVMQVGEES